MNNKKVTVTILSDANFLALNLLENLLGNNCYINIYADDVRRWEERTSHLVNQNNFSISSKNKVLESTISNYSIYCGGFINKEKTYGDIEIFQRAASAFNSKNILIFPMETYEGIDHTKISLGDTTAIVYVGDLIGPRVDLQSDLLLPQTINKIIYNRNLVYPVGEVLYPLFIGDAARQLSKWMLSFGPYGKETLLLGEDTSLNYFWELNNKMAGGNLKLTTDTDSKTRFIPNNVETKRIPTDLNFALGELYNWFSKNGTGETKIIEVKKTKVQKSKSKNKYPKYFRPSVILILLILIFPFLTLTLSFASFYFSYKQILRGENPKNILLIAKTFSAISAGESKILDAVPVLNVVYRETLFLGEAGVKLSDLSVNLYNLTRVGSNLVVKILGNDVYDPAPVSNELSVDLDSVYKNISLIEIGAKDSSERGSLVASYALEKINFEKLRNLSEQGRLIANKLPSILGKDKRETYLLLFQNNMELRPTGGFIGSFGILTFDGGRLSDMTVNDVYSADGQLNGHVEPPAPIKNYLGEVNWWLRDSNWDPDFPTSARRAEWFLDKEIGQEVDGVIAIDLSPIKSFLNVTGPIFLADYDMNITSQNLYEKTQSEVENNFFPGTHKKANFLTSLSKNLTNELGKMNGPGELGVLKSIFDNLNGRHIQVYMHDDIQSSFSSLGWDGSLRYPECLDNCYSDGIALVEANVGVNKANYFIDRNADLKVEINQQNINRELTLKISNKANPALGPSGRYKMYLRLFVPDDSQIQGVYAIFGQSTENLNTEILDEKGLKGIGVLVEVLGSQEKEIKFVWSSAFSSQDINSYGLYFRKQAGVDTYPLNITIQSNVGKLNANPKFSLTGDGLYKYNTATREDVFAHLGWQKQ